MQAVSRVTPDLDLSEKILLLWHGSGHQPHPKQGLQAVALKWYSRPGGLLWLVDERDWRLHVGEFLTAQPLQ